MSTCKTEPIEGGPWPQRSVGKRAKATSKQIFMTSNPKAFELRAFQSPNRQTSYESILRLSNDLFKQNLRYLHLQNQNFENQAQKTTKSQTLNRKSRQSDVFLVKKLPDCFPPLTKSKDPSDHTRELGEPIQNQKIKKPFCLSHLKMTQTKRVDLKLPSFETTPPEKVSFTKKRPLNSNYCDYFFLYKIMSNCGNSIKIFTKKIVRFPKGGSEFTFFCEKSQHASEPESSFLKVNPTPRDSKRQSKRFSTAPKKSQRGNMKLGIGISMFNNIEMEPQDFKNDEFSEKSSTQNICVIQDTIQTISDNPPSQNLPPPAPYTSKWMKLIENMLKSENLSQVGL